MKEKNKDKKTITVSFRAEGTNCGSCAEIIKRQAMKVKGVKKAEFDYAKETGRVIFNKEKTDTKKIFAKIEEKGYSCSVIDNVDDAQHNSKWSKALGWSFGIIGIIVVAYFFVGLIDGIKLPELSSNMGYGLLFLVGLLTGFHCVAMCGGFVVSYTAKDSQEGKSPRLSHLMYGVGK
ncbi:MAG: cation transporter, partial [Nanoarchaeota archaeon]|nr:cation transporter [Nanoarchaeota archaeon]